MIELLINAVEPQAFFLNLVGEATNDVSAKAAFFAIKSVGIALLGMTSNLRRPGATVKRRALKPRKRKSKLPAKHSVHRRN